MMLHSLSQASSRRAAPHVVCIPESGCREFAEFFLVAYASQNTTILPSTTPLDLLFSTSREANPAACLPRAHNTCPVRWFIPYIYGEPPLPLYLMSITLSKRPESSATRSSGSNAS